jgi:flagellar biosynthesis protein FlhF
MLLKRFEANSVPEALAAIRRELGENAVLLHTKSVAPAGLGRLFGRPRVEVLAAVDNAFEKVGPGAANRSIPGSAQMAPIPARAEETAAGHAPRIGTVLRPLYQRLSEQDVPDSIAQALLRAPQRKGGRLTLAAARRLLADRLAIAPGAWDRVDRRARRIAFVGPTGAGKTTTMAKVAARAQLTHGRRVGLVTTDTYRIGAVPQLKVYADLLEAPLRVVSRAAEMAKALGTLDGRDLVFIDTIGRSPLGSGVDELVPFLEAAGADEVHLVLPVTTRSADLLRATKAFARLRPNRLCFTKLDETGHYGGILAVSHETGLPLSWLGTGQEVPDDLEEARPERIVTAIMAGDAA